MDCSLSCPHSLSQTLSVLCLRFLHPRPPVAMRAGSSTVVVITRPQALGVHLAVFPIVSYNSQTSIFTCGQNMKWPAMLSDSACSSSCGDACSPLRCVPWPLRCSQSHIRALLATRREEARHRSLHGQEPGGMPPPQGQGMRQEGQRQVPSVPARQVKDATRPLAL
jgi:hypothetical protein